MSFLFPTIKGDNTPPPSSGHVSVYWNDSIILWGGYNDGDSGVLGGNNEYHPSVDVWVFGIETCMWKKHKTTGSIPAPLSGACASCIGHHMYLFAGHGVDRGHTSEVYALNLKTFEWQNLTHRIVGDKPSSRDKFSCWAHKGFVIYFGGYGSVPTTNINSGAFVLNTVDQYAQHFGWNNHLFVLDTLKLTWSQPDAGKDLSKKPCPRAAHAVTKLGNKGYLFGGRFLETRRNDLHCLDLDTWEWSGSIKTTGTVPEGRSWHSLSAVSDRHLFLYGGFNNNKDVLGDAWILDTHCMMWSMLPSPVGSPVQRMWHTACSTSSDGEVVIYGGCVNCVLGPDPPEHCNSIMMFRFSANSLSRLCADVVVKNLAQHLGELKKLPSHVIHSLILPERLNLGR